MCEVCLSDYYYLVKAFGKPIQAQAIRPGGWDGEYLDPLGYAYFGADGKLVGLRSNAGHIHPLP